MDISPLRIFISWGSSSSPVARRNRPTRVIRGSSRILNTSPSISLYGSSADRSSPAPTHGAEFIKPERLSVLSAANLGKHRSALWVVQDDRQSNPVRFH